MKSRSTFSRALFATVLFPMIAQPRPLQANPFSQPSGSYELTARLELPHLERWGVDKTTLICLSNSRGPDDIPVPVVSANNPFAKCSATNLIADGSRIEYDIVCPRTRLRKGARRIRAFVRRVHWSHCDGDGREKHDDDRSATCPPDRRVQPGEARISRPVLELDQFPAKPGAPLLRPKANAKA